MKKIYLLLSFALLACNYAVAEPGHGHEGHDHAAHGHEEKKAGPNGGRMIQSIEPHLEFFVREDRKVQLSAFDHDGKVVAVDTLSAVLIGGSRAAPVSMKFTKEGDVLVSDVALPEMTITPVVLTLKFAEGKKARVKFNVNMSDCGSCDYKEYACTCGH